MSYAIELHKFSTKQDKYSLLCNCMCTSNFNCINFLDYLSQQIPDILVLFVSRNVFVAYMCAT